jgi:hypothetical protein
MQSLDVANQNFLVEIEVIQSWKAQLFDSLQITQQQYDPYWAPLFHS